MLFGCNLPTSPGVGGGVCCLGVTSLPLLVWGRGVLFGCNLPTSPGRVSNVGVLSSQCRGATSEVCCKYASPQHPSACLVLLRGILSVD